jgi:hypothetical protein
VANDKPPPDHKKTLAAQRRTAQAALDKNRKRVGPNKYRALTPRERAAYQRVVKRADKVLGPIAKPGAFERGAEGLAEGLNVLKRFAERVKAGKERIEDIPEEMEPR